jgi:hypothetical protein
LATSCAATASLSRSFIWHPYVFMKTLGMIGAIDSAHVLHQAKIYRLSPYQETSLNQLHYACRRRPMYFLSLATEGACDERASVVDCGGPLPLP